MNHFGLFYEQIIDTQERDNICVLLIGGGRKRGAKIKKIQNRAEFQFITAPETLDSPVNSIFSL